MTTLSPQYIQGFLDALRRIHAEYTKTNDAALKQQWWTQELNMLKCLATDIDPAVAKEGLLGPLNELNDGLLTLRFGVATAPLQPVKLSHRPPDPKWDMFRGYVAGASELLIRSGARASIADTWVAEWLSRRGYLRADPGSSA